MTPLAIHQITAMEAQPPELVSIAAAVGAQGVCIFTNLPDGPRYPGVSEATTKAMRERLDSTGIVVTNIEYFSVRPDKEVESYEAGLAIGAELGAKRIVTHVREPDEALAVDKLGRLAELAGRYGLDVGLEFMGLSLPCNSIQRAVFYVDQVNRPNLGVAVDFLHLVRTGGTAQDVASVRPELIKYAQICDGLNLDVSSDYMPEAIGYRSVPGEGCFPIVDILKALPPTAALDVEVPRPQDRPALERARRAVDAARRLLEIARPEVEKAPA